MTVPKTRWSVISGSTGGIGTEISRILAARGDSMILVNRSVRKSEAQRDELVRSYPGLKVVTVIANLMDTGQIFSAAEAINEIPGRISVLYNIAGVLTSERNLSVQGLESQFAVNTLAPFLLLRNLRAKMSGQSVEEPAMIINFSSGAITRVKALKADELPTPKTVGGLMDTYAKTKLALTALAPALADSLKQDNILIRAVDPGPTKSPMTTERNSGMPLLLALAAPLLFRAADRQAEKVVASADPTAFGGKTGIYAANRKEKRMPKIALDQQFHRELLRLLKSFDQSSPR